MAKVIPSGTSRAERLVSIAAALLLPPSDERGSTSVSSSCCYEVEGIWSFEDARSHRRQLDGCLRRKDNRGVFRQSDCVGDYNLASCKRFGVIRRSNDLPSSPRSSQFLHLRRRSCLLHLCSFSSSPPSSPRSSQFARRRRFFTSAAAFFFTHCRLAAYIFTTSIPCSWRVSEALEYGLVGVSEGIISTEVAPFGGVKQSATMLHYVCMGNIKDA